MSWKPTTDPVVITCALTGGIHGKEANEALPEQPDEIVEQVFFPNHRDDIERFAHEIRDHGVRPELEVYSVAMLEEVEHLLSLQILEPPYAINFVLHTPTQGGQRGTPRNLLDAVERLRDLPVDPADLRVTVTSMGPTQLPLTTIGIAISTPTMASPAIRPAENSRPICFRISGSALGLRRLCQRVASSATRPPAKIGVESSSGR